MFDRSTKLFIVLGGFFVCNALIAEFLGVKIFALEPTLGLAPFGWNLFGQSGSLSFTAGVLLWPVVFIMTDIINEYYGRRGVKLLSYLTVGLILYAFGFAYLSIGLAPADWWIGIQSGQGVPDMQAAFSAIFGQSLWIIIGSVVAFLIGQIVDVAVFHRIRRFTGERSLWARATGSTLISQFIDSFVVLYVAFVLGPQQWSMGLFLAVGTVNYVYKFIIAIALTPLIYLGHALIDRYLGDEVSRLLRERAMVDQVSGP
ncbi:queuosine precursor transporter [Thermochromatium tepidum]|uniref:Probable queuosine precursor transporter n=1 Tax=Thermochromatium tepidum ATCC 43061 TaxID=316276 RepID=A0A6I6EHJ6_THETI|nr:queuosine precursor transporter [Thermochromatium tepidum]QGU33720.1 queuosine precursor transporter [Thermochromatium tepidum ATCC 43061]